MNKAIPFFALVVLSFFLNPFPALERESYMGSGGGAYLAVRFGLFLALLFIAWAVRNDRLAPRTAARLAMAAWLALAALFAAPVGTVHMLAPISVLAIFQWAVPAPVSENSPLAKLPGVGREILAFCLAWAGVGMALASFGQGPIKSHLDVNYLQLALGIAGSAGSLVVALTDCSRPNFSRLAVLTYGATLVIMTALLMFEIMRALPGETQLILATLALTNVMLIIQIVRHYGREHVLSKLVETAIGGMIFGGSVEFTIALTYADSGWFILLAVIWIPLILLAMALAVFGLRLIWSTENRLNSLWNRARGTSFR